jgi:hypothetical protein
METSFYAFKKTAGQETFGGFELIFDAETPSWSSPDQENAI